MSSSRFRKLKIFAILSDANIFSSSIRKKAESENIDKLKSGEITVSKDSSFSSDKELVKFIQNKLIETGFALPRYGPDGIIGPETDSAIRKAQELMLEGNVASESLIVPGVVDAIFLRGLEGISGKSQPDSSVESEESSSVPQKSEISSGDVLYIGSSSLIGPLGKMIKSALGPGKTFAEVGSQPNRWLGGEWQSIRKAISTNPKKIIIVTGGNGIAGASDLVSRIKKTLNEFGFSDTKLVWIGPNPFGADSFDSNKRPYNAGTTYSYLNDPNSFAQANLKRKNWNDELKGLVESAGGTFIDPFEYLKLEDGRPGFYCKSCDGIHLTSSASQDLFSKISGMI